MKNKKLKYLLILFVIVVWSTIFYKAFNHFVEPNEFDFKRGLNLKKDTSFYTFDTFVILANYPDPFLKGINNNNNENVAKVLKSSKPQNSLSVIKSNWPDIIYNGLVQNNKGNKLTVLITINGTSYIMDKGESIDKVELLGIAKDSLKVKFANTTKYIRRYENR